MSTVVRWEQAPLRAGAEESTMKREPNLDVSLDLEIIC
jgi:hypothetical protein